MFLYNILVKTTGCLLISGVEILYFWENNALLYFYEHTILKPILFAKELNIPYYRLFTDSPLAFKALSLILPIIIVSLFFKYIFSRNYEIKSISLILLLYSIANFIIIYPLADPLHLIFASVIPIISISYLLNNEKQLNVNLFNQKRFYIFISIIMITFFSLGIITNKNYNNTLDIKHYKHIHFSNDAARKLIEIKKYIEEEISRGKKIFFLDYQSALYLIPLEIFNYKSDSMLRSDLDADVENQIIQKISSDENNIIVLVRDRYSSPNRQETDVFVNYVANNMNYLTNIGSYDVYSN
jgi:hypothetical protein